MREKGVTVRGRRLKLLIVAVLAVSATATAGAALKATQGGTLVFGGSADPTYLDPALASDGETFRVTEQIFEGVVKLTQKTGTFINWLVRQPFTMQSPTAMKKYGADQAELKNGTFSATGTYAFSHPTGTGPYKFVSWTVGQKGELAKNQ